MSKHGRTFAGPDPESEDVDTSPLGSGGEDVGHAQTLVLNSGPESVADQPPVEQLQPGSVLRDRYLLKEKAGTGGMGTVFKAIDRHLADFDGANATVAIKVLAPELYKSQDALRALQREAAKGRMLSHPGIVRFIDLDKEDDLFFLVKEWLDGQSLADVLDAGMLAGDLPRVLDILRQIAEALEYAHQHGVVHADVKPGNIMLLPDGSTKLIDFGIARICNADAGGQPAQSAATKPYASMQVLTGETPAVTDDVFSLACLAYRMIAGHRVFGPRNAAEAAEAGMEPQRPELLGDSQWSALKKGLSHARIARQQSPVGFFNELSTEADYAGEEPLLEIPADAIAERRFEERPLRWPIYLALLLAAVAVAFFVQAGSIEAGLTQARSLVADIRERVVAPLPKTAVDDPIGRGEQLPAALESTADVPSIEQPAARDTGFDAAARESVDVSIPDQPAEAASINNVDSAATSAEDSGSINALPRLEIGDGSDRVPRIQLSVMEGGSVVRVELQRSSGLAEPLLVRIDEIGFSGSRSPGKAGDYSLSGDGVISFDARQEKAELIISATDDSEREPDRLVNLSLRDYYNAESVLAQLELRLLDDDQRGFEANLPANTVTFVTRSLIVRERDPAAQIDILRLNPDRGTLAVRYFVQDLTAFEGEDYFVPTQQTITFGPGQRNARLLISLVQDTVPEGDEHFAVELDAKVSHESTSARISVTIQDDDAIAE